jgi:flagellar basal-body rod protein FlgB
MGLVDIPIVAMLRTRLQWAQERQRVLAENVANADTPGFRPHDLTQPDFGPVARPAPLAPAQVSLAVTDAGHIGGGMSGTTLFRTTRAGGYEIHPTGNAVSLEDEMMKVAANALDYQAVSALYTQSLNLLKTALGKK